MPGFGDSKHATPPEWDGYTERRTAPVPPGNPGDPVTREYLDKALRESRHSTRDFVGGQIADLKALIQDGFPDGDTRAHREVHERWIDRAADRAALFKSIREKLAVGAVYAAAILVAKSVWEHVTSLINAAGPK